MCRFEKLENVREFDNGPKQSFLEKVIEDIEFMTKYPLLFWSIQPTKVYQNFVALISNFLRLLILTESGYQAFNSNYGMYSPKTR